MKKNNLFMVSIILLLIIVISSFGSLFSITGLDLSSSVIYTPVFTNVECDVVEPNHVQTYDFVEQSVATNWLKVPCASSYHNVYTNLCEISISSNAVEGLNSAIRSVYICDKNVEFGNKELECIEKDVNSKFYNTQITNNQILYVQGTEYIFGNVEVGDLSLTITSDWYGLKSYDSNNFLTKEYGCDVSGLVTEGFTYFDKDLEGKTTPDGALNFDAVMNYVSAVTPTISKNIILYENKVVWTIGNGMVYPIVTDTTGKRFVDINSGIDAPEIICNPALPYCNDLGTALTNIDATEKSCNDIYGSFLNSWIPSTESIYEVVKQECSSEGYLVVTEKKLIPICKQDEILNKNYECVRPTSINDNETITSDNTFYFIALLVVILLIMLMIVIKNKQKKRGRK